MKRTLTALLLAGVLPAAAPAQDGEVPAAVEARHGIMKNYSFNLSTLGDMAKGEIAYDAEAATTAADRLVRLSDLPQSGYWPDGTSSEDLEQSRALPAVWESMDDFVSGFGEMHEAALAMQEVAGDGRDAVAGQMRSLGQSCGGCHDDYRMSDD